MRATRVKKVSAQVLADVAWWRTFAPQFNGIALMSEVNWSKPDEVFSCDACKIGGGSFLKGRYFHVAFPEWIVDLDDINHLECITLMVSLNLWAK